MWNAEEKKSLMLAGIAVVNSGSDSTAERWLAVATRAVELVAARGGTMTAKGLADLWRHFEINGDSHPAERIRQHIAAQGARNATLEAENARLRERPANLERDVSDARDAAEAERVDNIGLSANLTEACRKADEQRERAEGAESRLQRMRDGISDMVKRCVEMAKVVGEPTPEERPRTTVTRDAPLLCLACGAVHPHRWFSRGSEQGEGWRCSACGVPPATGRYPCSPTCTHDDAATPGHPERVKARSEAFTQACIDARHTMTATGCGQCSGSAIIFSATESGDQEAAPLEPLGLYGPKEVSAWNAGVDAGRAACWQAVQEVLQRLGMNTPGPISDVFKAAIEGAAP